MKQYRLQLLRQQIVGAGSLGLYDVLFTYNVDKDMLFPFSVHPHSSCLVFPETSHLVS